MGILIKKGDTKTTWETPLIGGMDNNWNDNTWIVEHLRQLASKIEDENPDICNIGLNIDSNYKIPNIVIEIYNK